MALTVAVTARSWPRHDCRAQEAGRNQFHALSATRRQARFEAHIAADEYAFAAEFLPVGREYFESRENVPRRAATRYGHASFF